MKKTIATKVMGSDSSTALWRNLDALYGAYSKSRADETRTKIQTTHKGSSSMADYLCLKRQWVDTLSLAGDPYPNSQLIVNVFSGLDMEYLFVILQVEALFYTSWPELQDLLLGFDSKMERLVVLFGSTVASPQDLLVHTPPSSSPHKRSASQLPSGFSRGSSPNRGGGGSQSCGRGGRFSSRFNS
ncbi:uncharacterized protein LOC133799631 [Humulus lupulus]|uniref:uncharacterized protein LOC133799631 n=1 Tax=Humulus lupulus TaxID=3486 RepID=UPI002B401968|nr:uncharacterized protein LOC133799631 [Humulus lupulus]